MTWHSADEAVNTHSCDVPGCTGISYQQHGLCQWHNLNGTPDMVRTRPEPVDVLQARIDELDKGIARSFERQRALSVDPDNDREVGQLRDAQQKLMEERRRVYRRLTRAKEAA